MKHICTFPDHTKVEVIINTITKEGTHTQVQWTSERGLISGVWVPSTWVVPQIQLST